MKTLVLWRSGTVNAARGYHAAGASLVLWGDDGSELRRAGVPFRLPSDCLGHTAIDAADEAAIVWTKAWGRQPLLDGRSFRDLFQWRGLSLWWFAELYLHHSTAATRWVRYIETWSRLIASERPEEIEGAGLTPAERQLLARTCVAHGVFFHGRDRNSALRPRLRAQLKSLEGRWNTVKTLGAALKTVWRGSPAVPAGAPAVLFLSHAAFWRQRVDPLTGTEHAYEHYFDRVIPAVAADAVLEPFVVAVGPQAAFRRRRGLSRLREWLSLGDQRGLYVHISRFTTLAVWRDVARAAAEFRRLWQRLRRSPGVNAAFSHRGVSFAELSEPDFAGTLLLQLPWAVRSVELL